MPKPIDTTRYLTRDQQFCTLCFSMGHGWVRISNVSDLVLLRREYTERQAMDIYRHRRIRRLRTHYRKIHPGKELV